MFKQVVLNERSFKRALVCKAALFDNAPGAHVLGIAVNGQKLQIPHVEGTADYGLCRLRGKSLSPEPLGQRIPKHSRPRILPLFVGMKADGAYDLV